MYIWAVLFLSVGLSDSRFTDSRRHNNNPPGSGVSPFTRIAVEFSVDDAPEDLFLKGGFTNGDPERCIGEDAASDPCSIPIIDHIIPVNASQSYINWAHNDLFLDFKGGEAGQGEHNGQAARGTPMDLVPTELALEFSNTVGHRMMHKDKVFWCVELELNCADTDGFFEIEIVQSDDDDGSGSRRTPSNKPRNPSLQTHLKRLNFPKNFDFSKLPTFSRDLLFKSMREPPIGFNFTERSVNNTHRDAHRLRGEPKPPKAFVWKTGMDTSTEQHAKLAPKRRGPPSRAPVPHTRTCFGDAGFHAPYKPSAGRYMGRCGYANLFRINTSYCETNVIH